MVRARALPRFDETENLLQRKLRSNLTGAGNARILPGRGADGAVRDGRFTDAEGVCVERLDAVYEQPRGGSIITKGISC